MENHYHYPSLQEAQDNVKTSENLSQVMNTMNEKTEENTSSRVKNFMKKVKRLGLATVAGAMVGLSSQNETQAEEAQFQENLENNRQELVTENPPEKEDSTPEQESSPREQYSHLEDAFDYVQKVMTYEISLPSESQESESIIQEDIRIIGPEISLNPDGESYTLEVQGQTVELHYQDNGKLTNETVNELQEQGATIDYQEEEVTIPTTDPESWQENLPTTPVRREDWYDYNLPQESIRNELGLHISYDKETDVYRISSSMNEESIKDDQEIIPAEIFDDLQVVFSASEENQNSPLVDSLGSDGTLEISSDHPAYDFFEHSSDKEVYYHGQFLEIAEEIPPNAEYQEEKPINPLATHIGSNTTEEIEVTQYTPIVEFPEDEENPSIPFFIPPIPGRRKKEESEQDTLDTEPPMVPGSPYQYVEIVQKGPNNIPREMYIPVPKKQEKEKSSFMQPYPLTRYGQNFYGHEKLKDLYPELYKDLAPDIEQDYSETLPYSNEGHVVDNQDYEESKLENPFGKHVNIHHFVMELDIAREDYLKYRKQDIDPQNLARRITHLTTDCLQAEAYLESYIAHQEQFLTTDTQLEHVEWKKEINKLDMAHKVMPYLKQRIQETYKMITEDFPDTTDQEQIMENAERLSGKIDYPRPLSS